MEETMKPIEIDFSDDATPEMKETLLGLIERATTLDEIFEEWFLKQGNLFGLSLAVDDDDNVIPNTISIFFDTADRKKILSLTISRHELIKAYPQVAPFSVFVKGWDEQRFRLELHELKYNRWLKRLGFVDSNALMSVTGSRSAALTVMVSFALSGKGIAEVNHLDPNDFDPEDYEADLEEEGIDLEDYFFVMAAYQKGKGGSMCTQALFNPFYCKKAA
jgi:hypothetical protein